jgi:hypothetical protein
MADDRGIQFGSVLDKPRADKKVWLLVVPALVALAAAAFWAINTVSKADSLQAEAARGKARVAELEKSVEDRDRMLAEARKNEDLMKTPGQATGMFLRAAPDATESGVVLANPDQKAARVYLYGMVAPPDGQEYVVLARPAQGDPKVLGVVIPNELGSGFLLSRDVPEGTATIELAWRPAHQGGAGSVPASGAAQASGSAQALGSGDAQRTAQAGGDQGQPQPGDAKPEPNLGTAEGAKVRVFARYPATPDDRGILMQPPAQARRGAR